MSFPRQDSSKVGFKMTEKFLHSRIEKLAKKLLVIDDLVHMTMEVNQKTLHEFIIKRKEQTMEFYKKV